VEDEGKETKKIQLPWMRRMSATYSLNLEFIGNVNFLERPATFRVCVTYNSRFRLYLE